ncbi:MAG: N-acetylmuramoyl-L-alanine amidase [Steroidobacteraceae bacterium]
MIKKVFELGLVAVLVGGANVAMAAGAELREATLSATGTSAQLTLDVAGTTTQKIFALDKPRRVVIDLTHTGLARGFRIPEGSGVVSNVRTGHQLGGTLRIVVQLRAPAPARSTWMPETSSGRRQLIVSFGDAAPEADTTPRAVRAPHAPTDSDRDVVIAVDAGHGGQDPGATGPRGTHEKDVVLPIARLLAERINGEPGMRAVLTRNRDEFLVLRDRIRRARVAKADMFISVHADSIANHDVTGASVYILSERGATNESARWLAERENAADLMGGVTLDDKDNTLASVLLDLSQSANISASKTAAQRVLAALDNVGQVRKPQVQQAGFVVLKSPDIPSMLVETAYISNATEERRLKNPRQQANLAAAIFAGVRNYFEQNPPAGTRFAQARRATIASVAATSPPPN